jgi:hypothetical protein
MGICLEAEYLDIKIHPTLGILQHIQTPQRKLLKQFLPINEDNYLAYCKKINKLKYHNELKHLLYLPLQQQYQNS